MLGGVSLSLSHPKNMSKITSTYLRLQHLGIWIKCLLVNKGSPRFRMFYRDCFYMLDNVMGQADGTGTAKLLCFTENFGVNCSLFLQQLSPIF